MLGIPEAMWGLFGVFSTLVVGGVSGLYDRIHRRMEKMEGKVHEIERDVIKHYLTKEDFNGCMDRLQNHMTRIENKLDTMRPCD